MHRIEKLKQVVGELIDEAEPVSGQSHGFVEYVVSGETLEELRAALIESEPVRVEGLVIP